MFQVFSCGKNDKMFFKSASISNHEDISGLIKSFLHLVKISVEKLMILFQPFKF